MQDGSGKIRIWKHYYYYGKKQSTNLIVSFNSNNKIHIFNNMKHVILKYIH